MATNFATGNNTGGHSNITRTSTPAEDVTSPFCLHPSDNPGAIIVCEQFTSDNFISWSRAVLMALNVKNKHGFVDGSIHQPSPSDAVAYICWQRANNLVLSWLLNSIAKDIRQSLLYFTSARDVWEELRTRYVRSDGPRVFHLERSLSSISQGSLSVTSYYNLFKGLWDEFLSYRPLVKCTCRLCTCNVPTHLAAIQQSDYVIKILVGLNESYSQIRSQLLLSSLLPTLAKVYSLLLQEESQRNLNNSAPQNLSMESTMAMLARHGGQGGGQCGSHRFQSRDGSNKFQRKAKKKPTCAHCGWPGHTIERCFQLIGYPPNWPGHKGPRQPPPASANVVVSDFNQGQVAEPDHAEPHPLFTPKMITQFVAYARSHRASSHPSTPGPAHTSSVADAFSNMPSTLLPSTTGSAPPASVTGKEFDQSEDDWFCRGENRSLLLQSSICSCSK